MPVSTRTPGPSVVPLDAPAAAGSGPERQTIVGVRALTGIGLEVEERPADGAVGRSPPATCLEGALQIVTPDDSQEVDRPDGLTWQRQPDRDRLGYSGGPPGGGVADVERNED